MMDQEAINDLIHKSMPDWRKDQLPLGDNESRLLSLYRKKRAVDGLNGRTWDAVKHHKYNAAISALEHEAGTTAPPEECNCNSSRTSVSNAEICGACGKLIPPEEG